MPRGAHASDATSSASSWSRSTKTHARDSLHVAQMKASNPERSAPLGSIPVGAGALTTELGDVEGRRPYLVRRKPFRSHRTPRCTAGAAGRSVPRRRPRGSPRARRRARPRRRSVPSPSRRRGSRSSRGPRGASAPWTPAADGREVLVLDDPGGHDDERDVTEITGGSELRTVASISIRSVSSIQSPTPRRS